MLVIIDSLALSPGFHELKVELLTVVVSRVTSHHMAERTIGRMKQTRGAVTP